MCIYINGHYPTKSARGRPRPRPRGDGVRMAPPPGPPLAGGRPAARIMRSTLAAGISLAAQALPVPPVVHVALSNCHRTCRSACAAQPCEPCTPFSLRVARASCRRPVLASCLSQAHRLRSASASTREAKERARWLSGSGWRLGRVRWGRPLLSRPRGAVGSGPAVDRLLSRPRFRPSRGRLVVRA